MFANRFVLKRAQRDARERDRRGGRLKVIERVREEREKQKKNRQTDWGQISGPLDLSVNPAPEVAASDAPPPFLTYPSQ